MDEPKDTFSIENKGGISVVTFQGSGFLDEAKIDLIGVDLLEALTKEPATSSGLEPVEREKPQVVIDMIGVRFCSSSIIGKLITTYKTIVGLGGKMKFASLEKAIADVFHVTKLDRLFEIYDNADAAVESFK